jgi:ribosomal protein L7/L12
MLKSEDFGIALDDASKHLQAGGSLEALLFELRKRGADKIDSIKVIKSAMALSMPQAKSLVDRSETWSDRYAQDKAFHEMAREVASKLSIESKEPTVIFEGHSPDPKVGE